MDTPSALRTGCTCAIAGLYAGANRNVKLEDSNWRTARSGSRSSGMFSASSTSADPDLDDTERLPHLIIFTPPAAATSEAAVVMLMVFAPSPPVPAVSMSPSPVTGNGRPAARNARAAPATSANVSPRVRMVASSAAMWTSS